MNWIAQAWPFDYGQQHIIFATTGICIIGLVALNLFSALRQRLPMNRVLTSLFVQIPTRNRIERSVRTALIAWLALGFVILALDIQINGMQLVAAEWISRP